MTSPSAPTSASTNCHLQTRVPTMRATSTHAPPSNLRSITLNLIYKLRTTRLKTAQQLANELAKDCCPNSAHSTWSFTNGRVANASLSATNSRNLRRRVYDALQVLRALHLTQAFPSVRWNFVSSDHNDGNTEVIVLERLTRLVRARIERKRKNVKQLSKMTASLFHVIERNRRLACAEGPRQKQSRIELPFFVLRSKCSTELRAECSVDARWLGIGLSAPFQVINDVGIIMRLFCLRASAMPQVVR
ncbi:Transcription factor dpl-1 [Gracilariopsis chorda]|uniref:Transcription factor dpl-1 n=1 Tax=Gracilariopsis chorda TaxID=448386 RepID=A0A2V3IXY4_9FLOR|nr:Transcription factor dpl-1 [Gracilariopsis chorda]|eukprot:PXF47008.1 Transcription factor dpl-1 [Gracilariopsis chorda]